MLSTENNLKFLYQFIDLVILNTALAICFAIHPILYQLNITIASMYLLHANLSCAITYTICSRTTLYLNDSFANRMKRINGRILVYVLVAFTLAQFFLPRTYSRIFIIQSAVLFYLGKTLFYYSLFTYLKYRRLKGSLLHNVLILGQNDAGIILRDVLNCNPMLGYKVIGFVAIGNSQNINVVGHISNFSELVIQHQAEIIFITLSEYIELNKNNALLALCNKTGVRLRIVPENQHWFRCQHKHESIGSMLVINPQEIPLDDINARFAKRAFDIIFSSLVIITIISWLFPLLCLLIKISSKGPVFFSQQRTGINNRTFTCFKFRSMYVNADADTKQATLNDSRITPIGKFMRKTNLDEFPQFFNVLVGNMSVVGPRPHMLKHTYQYTELIEHYKVRHYVKPGITGWAQVNGYRGETDELWKMQKRVEYDMHYLENWHFWWDLKIVVMTLFCKMVRTNAY